MELVLKIYQYLTGPEGAVVFAALFALSEALSLIPSVKASGVFQAVMNGLKYVKEKVFPPKLA